MLHIILLKVIENGKFCSCLNMGRVSNLKARNGTPVQKVENHRSTVSMASCHGLDGTRDLFPIESYHVI